jgi:hypothetical protein
VIQYYCVQHSLAATSLPSLEFYTLWLIRFANVGYAGNAISLACISPFFFNKRLFNNKKKISDTIQLIGMMFKKITTRSPSHQLSLILNNFHDTDHNYFFNTLSLSAFVVKRARLRERGYAIISKGRGMHFY